jgi:hypothetical protein
MQYALSNHFVLELKLKFNSIHLFSPQKVQIIGQHNGFAKYRLEKKVLSNFHSNFKVFSAKLCKGNFKWMSLLAGEPVLNPKQDRPELITPYLANMRVPLSTESRLR